MISEGYLILAGRDKSQSLVPRGTTSLPIFRFGPGELLPQMAGKSLLAFPGKLGAEQAGQAHLSFMRKQLCSSAQARFLHMPAKALPQPQFPVTTRVLGLQAVHLTWTVPVSSLYKDHFATRKIHDVKICQDIS